MKEIQNIVIIGAGNVGTRLGYALRDAGCNIVQVAGRREEAVKSLAGELGASWTLRFDQLLKEQDLYILALPDRAMKEIMPQLGLSNELLVHTSGSVSMDILSGYSKNTGVLYPLQTFTSSREINLSEVPFLVEGNNPHAEKALLALAAKLSTSVRVADSARRMEMHIGAVFVCNFSNHMYHIASKLFLQYGYDFHLLAPLIRETAAKAVDMKPAEAQTGPAIRNDSEVIDKHLALLKDYPEIQELYKKISQNIIDQSDKEHDEL